MIFESIKTTFSAEVPYSLSITCIDFIYNYMITIAGPEHKSICSAGVKLVLFIIQSGYVSGDALYKCLCAIHIAMCEYPLDEYKDDIFCLLQNLNANSTKMKEVIRMLENICQ
eukprot:TRINITY_DN1422_c0_g1_i6.p1 TRINITY_DN1422_c0_g1~~TRINITY_DN1422_c0_g1_i6.p1  ORF type:complete len:113 (+),score=12.43 TRINITY_DN1422_c0_g1_i6:266-604(+)